MANLGGVFNASEIAPSTPMETLPAGKYPVQIIQSEMRPTNNGNGQYLWLELEVIDGEFKGRKLWDRLNLVNANTTAVEIAQRALSAICHAVGVMAPSDSEELHFKPLTAAVKVRPAGPDKSGVHRDAQNEIGGYAASGAVSSARPAVAVVARQAASQPVAAAAPAVPPWRKVAG